MELSLTKAKLDMLDGNHRCDQHATECQQYDPFDKRLEQERRIVLPNDTGKEAEATTSRRRLQERNPGRQPDTWETIDAMRLQSKSAS